MPYKARPRATYLKKAERQQIYDTTPTVASSGLYTTEAEVSNASGGMDLQTQKQQGVKAHRGAADGRTKQITSSGR